MFRGYILGDTLAEAVNDFRFWPTRE